MKQFFLIAAIIFSLSANAQTKEKPKADTNYVMVGKFADFQLLYKALMSPGDVTPNQVNALAAWIQKIQAIPAKEEEVKKEKPKN